MNFRWNVMQWMSCSRAACHSLLTDRTMLLTDFVIATSIPFIIQLLIWNSIFEKDLSNPIFGFSYQDIIIYYAIALTMGRLNNGYDIIRQISEHLDAGSIEPLLTKPLSIPARQFYTFLGESIIYLAPVGFSLTICAFFANKNTWDFTSIIIILIAIILSQVVTFLLSLNIGLIAFWLVKSDFLCSLHITLMAVLGGTLLPANLWPVWLAPIMSNNPFYLQIGAIADLAVHPDHDVAFRIVASQLLWVVIFLIGSVVLWRRGITRLTSTGG